MSARECGWQGLAPIRLSRREEIKLCRRMRRGDRDREARDRLIQSQLPWVVKIAIQNWRPGHDVDDLVGVGLSALLVCLHRFDARKGRLTTFCYRPVKWRIQAHIRKFSAIVSRPFTIPRRTDLLAKWKAAQRRQDMPLEIGCSEPARDGLGLELQQLHEAVEHLPPRLREVVRRRLSGETLEAIGNSYGVSKERVRQLHDLALRYLRLLLRAADV